MNLTVTLSEAKGTRKEVHSDWRGTDLARTALTGANAESETVFYTAGLQLFLEYHLFHPAGGWLCPAVARGAVGADRDDDQLLPQGGSACCPPADPVSAVGELCGISQFWCLAVEPLMMGESLQEHSCGDSFSAFLQARKALKKRGRNGIIKKRFFAANGVGWTVC